MRCAALPQGNFEFGAALSAKSCELAQALRFVQIRHVNRLMTAGTCT